jgi:RNA recognition motif-containing protein
MLNIIELVNNMSLQSRRTLYVGGLAEDVDDKMLRAAFITFGPIQSIDIVRYMLIPP